MRRQSFCSVFYTFFFLTSLATAAANGFVDLKSFRVCVFEKFLKAPQTSGPETPEKWANTLRKGVAGEGFR